MIIYKFGGASVKDAHGVRNLMNILVSRKEAGVVVLSALAKTTNHLEELTAHIYKNNRPLFDGKLSEIKRFHLDIMNNLFDEHDPVYERVEKIFSTLQDSFELRWDHYDMLYDQVVSFGELLSTRIVAEYLVKNGIPCRLVDIRQHLITDSVYREANIDWNTSVPRIDEHMRPSDDEIILTQGFIGGTRDKMNTTLGREGSDYTAAVLANILNAERLIIWKDVPGVLNADPRYFDHPEKLERISYQEAIELAYYGAKIIHPKTIKPLQNKGITLSVRSFLDPDIEGTLIDAYQSYDGDKPIFILKNRQVLISVLPRDFSFVVEKRLSWIYGLFAKHRIKVNMMQNSAINFTVCVDDDNSRINDLLDDLKQDFRVLYNKGLQLITVRHYNEQVLKEVQRGRRVLVEQRSRHTAQFLMEE